MKLSTKGRYAVMAMSDLAVQARLDAKRPVSLAEIGAREGISLSYLEQLFARLRRAGLVTSIRGAQGGFACQPRPPRFALAILFAPSTSRLK